MRAKSERRLLAERLRRQQGLSYNEITARTGISKSTLSYWLRAIPLTAEQEARLQARLEAVQSTFAARALPINRERYRRARERAYQGGERVVDRIPKEPCVDELAFAMLYLGEGSKRTGRVQLASMDPHILRYTLWVLRNLYNIDEKRLSFRLNLVEAVRPLEEQYLKWWCKELGCTRHQFNKTQYDSRSRSSRISEDYHGVCTVNYNDTYLQQRILGLAHSYTRGCATR